jgi:hypothetical protein
MWKNIVEPGRPQMTIWRIRIGYSIPYATNRYSEYIILIDFPLQQWLHERASLLTLYSVCLVVIVLRSYRA